MRKASGKARVRDVAGRLPGRRGHFGDVDMIVERSLILFHKSDQMHAWYLVAVGFEDTLHPAQLLDGLPKMFRDGNLRGILLKPASLLPLGD